MNTATSQQSSGGIGCLTVLGLIFITLKLTGNIGWSWWWVLAPFWMPISLILAGILLWFTAFMIREFWRDRKQGNQRK